MVNTTSLNAQSDINVRTDLTGEVRVKFRSETFPLARFADSAAIQLINQNARVPQAAPAAAPQPGSQATPPATSQPGPQSTPPGPPKPAAAPTTPPAAQSLNTVADPWAPTRGDDAEY